MVNLYLCTKYRRRFFPVVATRAQGLRRGSFSIVPEGIDRYGYNMFTGMIRVSGQT